MGNHYYISQRAQHIYQEISGATTSSRGIINTRDEPHADEERYRRLHVIVGDSNMSEVSTYLKVGTTALVLAMVEDGALRKDLALEDPVRAIKEISHDTTCRRKVRLKRGKEFSAIELQREYLELALEYYATAEVSPQVSDLLERWQSVLERLSEEPMSCARELDWVIKKELIHSYMTRKGIGFDDQPLYIGAVMYDSDPGAIVTADARRDAGLLLDVLTPIAKSWPSEFCLKANELAIQMARLYTGNFDVIALRNAMTQRELARRRMMSDVPKATVVITNTGGVDADSVSFSDLVGDPNLTLVIPLSSFQRLFGTHRSLTVSVKAAELERAGKRCRPPRGSSARRAVAERAVISVGRSTRCRPQAAAARPTTSVITVGKARPGG